MKTFAAALLLASLAAPAAAATVHRSYSYFTVGGTTIEEIEGELGRKGPAVGSGGARHPGATRMEFSTRIGFAEQNGRCRIVQADVTVKAQMILPRWNRRSRADDDTRLVWDTLSADIRRHEESHVVIARTHAREMEMALLDLPGERDCAAIRQKADEVTARILAKHDEEQQRFDRIEGINFESRMLRLLRYRMERGESGG